MNGPVVTYLSDHHHLWSPVEDLPDGGTVYECVVPGCDTERVVEGWLGKWGDRFVDAEGVDAAIEARCERAERLA